LQKVDGLLDFESFVEIMLETLHEVVKIKSRQVTCQISLAHSHYALMCRFHDAELRITDGK